MPGETAMTERGRARDSGRPSRQASARTLWRAAAPPTGIALTVALVTGCPQHQERALPLPAAMQRAIDDGARLAQSCDGEIDADLRPYIICIEARLGGLRSEPARRAGLRFQAWIMADLAVQQSAAGAEEARAGWWRGLQGDLTAARLTLEDLCARRGLSVDDIGRRVRRMGPTG